MRALFYLLTLTLCCFLKSGFCVISFEEFKADPHVMPLLAQYHNKEIKGKMLFKKLKTLNHGIPLITLKTYVEQIKEEAGGGSHNTNFDQFIKNDLAMYLVGQYNGQQNKDISTHEQLLTEVNKIEGLKKISKSTLIRYLKEIKKAGIGYRKNAFEQFKNDPHAMSLVEQFNNKQITDTELSEALKQINHKMSINSMYLYIDILNHEKKAGIGAPNLQASASASGNPGSSIPNVHGTDVPSQAGTDSTNWFGGQQNDEGTLESMTRNPSLLKSALGFLSSLVGASPQEPQFSPSMHDTPAASSYYPSNQPDDGSLQSMITPRNQKAPQIAQQSSNFTSGNPGSSTSASKKGKSTNFSKTPGASSHYGGAMPSQQVPPIHGTFVPSQAETDSTNWFGGNLQNDDGDLESMVNPPSSLKSALGFLSSLVGASPQEPQFSPPMHDTPAASSYYPSNDQTLESMITPRNQKGSASHYGGAMPFQKAPMPGTSSFPNYPFNQSAPLNPSTNFVLSQAGTHSTNFDGTLESMIRTGKPGSSTNASQGFGTTPFLPNQSQSTRRTGASNLFSPTPNTSNFTLGNRGSSSHYGGAMSSQQAPISGTSFPAFPNYPSNQSAQLNSSTNFGQSQPGTPSLDLSGGNSQNNDGSLYSVVNTKRLSSSKGKNAAKTGKKPRK